MRGAPGMIAIVAAAISIGGVARADGPIVCVGIDVHRDSLAPAEQTAVRISIETALEREGITVDRRGPCPPGAGVSAYAIKLERAVTVTITAGDGKVSGRAASLDEVDLLVSQLVRSLVTGRSLATGGGVTDRTNVLRDQTAPRRSDIATRRWDPMFALGGGVLQLPATADRPRHRQHDIIAIESRWWGFAQSERAALELYGRILLHDYAAIGAADDAYDRAKTTTDSNDEDGRFIGLLFSPLAVANYEAGFGFVGFGGARPPRPFVRLGATASLLFRFSDDDHYADIGFGGYGGVGLELTRHVSVSVAINASNPLVHNWTESGYWYFATATALLEIRGEGKDRRAPRFLTPEPVRVIRRINE